MVLLPTSDLGGLETKLANAISITLVPIKFEN